MKADDSRAQFKMSFGLENKTDRGSIKLHEGVISSVVKNAACSVKGVIRLAGNSLTDSIADILGTRKRNEGTINIELNEDKAKVELALIVEYGTNIPDIALGVQTKVIEDVKKITGLSVTEVDVVIQGIEEPVKETPKEETEDKASEKESK